MIQKIQKFILLVALVASSGSLLAGSYAFSNYEERVKQFEEEDGKAPPAAHPVLFVGSSSIDFWKTLAHDFPGMPVLNRGVAGSQYRDLVKFSDRIIDAYHPRQIVIYSGENDVFVGRTPADIAKNVKKLLEDIHRALPSAKVYVVSVKPSPFLESKMDVVRRTNQLIKKEVDESPGTRFLNVHTPMLTKDGQLRPELFGSDGLHMNEAGYKIWTKIIKEALEHDALADVDGTEKLKQGPVVKVPDCNH